MGHHLQVIALAQSCEATCD